MLAFPAIGASFGNAGRAAGMGTDSARPSRDGTETCMISINATLIVTMLNFILLVILLKMILFKPLVNFLDQRSGVIAESLRQAEENKSQAARIRSEEDQIMREARRKAAEIIDHAVATASDESRAVLAKTREEAQGMIGAARNEMLADSERIKRELRRELAGMVVSLSQQVLTREISETDHRKLIEEGLDVLNR